MTDELSRPSATTILLNLAAVVVIVAGLRAAQPLIVPFLLAAFLAALCMPLYRALLDQRVPTFPALLIVILALSLAGLVVVVYVGASLADFLGNLDTYEDKLTAQVRGLLDRLRDMGVEFSSDAVLGSFNPRAVMGLIGSLLLSLSGAFSNAFLILLTVIFLLLEASSFPEKLASASGGPGSLNRFRRIIADVRSYMKIKTIVSLLTGGLVYLWLRLVGVDYPLLWALLAFLLNFIPNIGSFIAAIPAVALAFIQYGTFPALWTAGFYLAINSLIGNFLEPRMMGRGLDLSTLVVFMSMVFWGWVLGPVGMILSTPLTITFKVILDRSPQTRWVSILLASEADYRPPPGPPRKAHKPPPDPDAPAPGE